MIELDELVFGKIKAKEILGAKPDVEDTRVALEQEMTLLLKNLDSLTKEELKTQNLRQMQLEKEINSRPGAMALPQNKIRLFTKYNSRYVEAIQERLV